jgi:protein required for attachment to host cells
MGGRAVKTLRNLYLLSSDRAFRFLRSGEAGLAEVGGGEADDFADVQRPFGSEIGRSRKGSITFDNSDRGAHLAEDRDRFQRHVAEALAVEWAKGGYDRIILCAGPKTLGALRDALPKTLVPHIAAELHKDLLKTPLHDLPAHFREVPGV